VRVDSFRLCGWIALGCVGGWLQVVWVDSFRLCLIDYGHDSIRLCGCDSIWFCGCDSIRLCGHDSVRLCGLSCGLSLKLTRPLVRLCGFDSVRQCGFDSVSLSGRYSVRFCGVIGTGCLDTMAAGGVFLIESVGCHILQTLTIKHCLV
jgi:hypothetical protein